MIEALELSITAIMVALFLGGLLGLMKASFDFYYVYVYHHLNRRKSQAFVVLSGSPEVVSKMYSICINVVNEVEKNNQKIEVANAKQREED